MVLLFTGVNIQQEPPGLLPGYWGSHSPPLQKDSTKKVSHYLKKATGQSIYVTVWNKTCLLQKYSIWTERHPGQELKDIIRKLQSKDVISG